MVGVGLLVSRARGPGGGMAGAAVLLGLLLTLMASVPARAQSDAEADTEDSGWTEFEGWEFQIAPYVWASGIEGDVTVRGTSVDVSASFADLLETLDVGFMGHVEARRGKGALFVNTVYTKLSDEIRRAGVAGFPFGVDVEAEMTIVELGAAYQVHEKAFPGGEALHVDVLGGGRYWDLEVTIDPLRLPDIEQSSDWVDPFVGARARIDLDERLALSVRGDIGGFDVGGDASHLTWNFVGLLGYRTSDRLTLWLGYRALDVDRGTGTGSIDVDADIRMSGPIFGGLFRF